MYKYLFIGRTCSGKDTLVRYLCEAYGMKQLISYTTRERREGEGDTHIFIKPEQKKEYKNIIAETKIGEYSYFATAEQLEEADCYIIDPKGLDSLAQNKELMQKYDFVVMYLPVSEDEQRVRALKRKDNMDVFEKRIAAEAEQFDEFETKIESESYRESSPFSYLVSLSNFPKLLAVNLLHWLGEELKISKILDNDLISIQYDGRGKKEVHFLGYAYRNGSDELKPYNLLEYVGFYAPLDMVCEMGIEKYERAFQEGNKQLVDAVNAREVYEFYGLDKKWLTILPKEYLSPDLSLGDYLVIDMDTDYDPYLKTYDLYDWLGAEETACSAVKSFFGVNNVNDIYYEDLLSWLHEEEPELWKECSTKFPSQAEWFEEVTSEGR